MLKTFASMLATAFTLAALAAPSNAGDLSDREIRDELVGKTIVWWEDGGWLHGHLFLLPDGKAEISVSHPRRAGDIGRWTLRDGEICTAWGEVRSGREKCYAVSRGASGRFLTSGGNVFEVREAGV
jgi:hypothetical protein